MSKKYYYYLVFILIPFYIFSGSIIDYIQNRDNIVNTLEMPQKNYDNTISDSQKYELDIDKFDKPIIKDSMTVSWLLNIKYTCGYLIYARRNGIPNNELATIHLILSLIHI